MLYEDVDFKTLSDRYTNSRMVPFNTHIDGVRANLFSINPRQKMTLTIVNHPLFFFLPYNWTQQTLFLLTTYLSENGPHHEKTCFCHMWTTKEQISLRIHAVWSASLLFAAWIVTRFYCSKLYSSIGTYTVSPTCQFTESVLSLHVHLVKSKCHPAGTVYKDSVSLCRHFVIHKRFCEFWDTDFLIVSEQWNQSL